MLQVDGDFFHENGSKFGEFLFSDAVVDWYGVKKLAYYYIKQAQQPVSVSMGEPHGWEIPVYITNDTLCGVSGVLTITDIEGKEIYNGAVECPVNASVVVTNLPVICSEFKVYLLKLETSDGRVITNHYTQGAAPFDFGKYNKALKAIAAHYGTFRADNIAK